MIPFSITRYPSSSLFYSYLVPITLPQYCLLFSVLSRLSRRLLRSSIILSLSITCSPLKLQLPTNKSYLLLSPLNLSIASYPSPPPNTAFQNFNHLLTPSSSSITSYLPSHRFPLPFKPAIELFLNPLSKALALSPMVAAMSGLSAVLAAVGGWPDPVEDDGAMRHLSASSRRPRSRDNPVVWAYPHPPSKFPHSACLIN